MFNLIKIIWDQTFKNDKFPVYSFYKGSNKFNIYGFGDLMKEGGWNLNILQEPACVHLCCTMLHAQSGVADRFINDVKVAVKKVNIDNLLLEPFL